MPNDFPAWRIKRPDGKVGRDFGNGIGALNPNDVLFVVQSLREQPLLIGGCSIRPADQVAQEVGIWRKASGDPRIAGFKFNLLVFADVGSLSHEVDIFRKPQLLVREVRSSDELAFEQIVGDAANHDFDLPIANRVQEILKLLQFPILEFDLIDWNSVEVSDMISDF